MNDGSAQVLAENGGGLGGIIGALISLAILVVVIVGGWKAFEKANKPGWAFFIPIYNVIVWLEIAGRPVWWIILILLIPFVNLILLIIVLIDVARSFGRGAGFGLGLCFLGIIFWPILGFGSAQYQGPAAAS